MNILTKHNINEIAEFDLSAIKLVGDIELITQYMMSGEDTAIISYEVELSKHQIAALVNRTDIIDVQYDGDKQCFYDKLFDENANFSVKAELRSNIYCLYDDISKSTARILLESDADNPWSVCSSWEAVLSDEEQACLFQMMKDYTREMPLENLVHYSKQASLCDIAVRNEHNGFQNITDFAVNKTEILSHSDKDIVCEFGVDTTKKRGQEIVENFRNRCAWQYNAENYGETAEEIVLKATVIGGSAELALIERSSGGEQGLSIPITQEEKDMLKVLCNEALEKTHGTKQNTSNEAAKRNSRKKDDIER